MVCSAKAPALMTVVLYGDAAGQGSIRSLRQVSRIGSDRLSRDPKIGIVRFTSGLRIAHKFQPERPSRGPHSVNVKRDTPMRMISFALLHSDLTNRTRFFRSYSSLLSGKFSLLSRLRP